MNKATIKNLKQIGELVKEEKHDPRQKFARVKEALEIYHIPRTTLLRRALDSGALYKVNGTILINLIIFDEYIETLRIPVGML